MALNRTIQDLIELLQLVHEDPNFVGNTYYSPRNMYPENAKIYYIFIQPFVLLGLWMWLVVLIRALRTGNFLRSYGFMTAYSCLDLFWITIQNIFFIYAFSLSHNYVQYDMCYVFEVFTRVVPLSLLLFSQWLKVAQAFQKYIILAKPTNFKDILNQASIGIFLAVILIVAIVTGSLFSLFIMFEKITTIDTSTYQNLEICRDLRAYGQDTLHYRYYLPYLEFVFVAFATIIPCLLMFIFGILSIYRIKIQSEFRKKFNVRKNAGQKGLDRLTIVTVCATIAFGFLSIPIVIYALPRDIQLVIISSQTYGLLYSMVFLTHIPINFIMFSWLSAPFRNKIKHIWDFVRRQNTSS